MKQKYICAGRCPELDASCDEHCKCTDPTTECPYGNNPIWITLACEIGGVNEQSYDD